jgi:heptaprenyl diphosphate synthase
LLFALAIALSFLESLAPLPIPAPGIKLGLSNIVVMYCLFLRGPAQGYLLCCLKALFVLLSRGPSGALLSICGGLLSVTVMILIRRFARDERYTISSVGGAVSHNMGQLACAVFLLGNAAALQPLFPVLTASGVAVGVLTAALLRALIPALEKITINRSH